jgi:hypothetical protein
MNAFVPATTSWKPYTTDTLTLPFEKLDRLSLSIKYGAFITESLYISPDVWSQTGLKYDNAELKQSAIQLLSKPLVKLLLIQQNEKNSNSGLAAVAIGEFMQDMEQVRSVL